VLWNGEWVVQASNHRLHLICGDIRLSVGVMVKDADEVEDQMIVVMDSDKGVNRVAAAMDPDKV